MRQHVTSLETPCLLVSESRFDRNARVMNGIVAKSGARLRQHVKTTKSVDLALRSLGGQPQPVTVSTLEEADCFAKAGFSDLFYAVGLAPTKIDHVARLVDAGNRVTVLLDSTAQATLLVERFAADSYDDRVQAVIEVDVDGGRGGLKRDDPTIVALARLLGRRFGGIMTYGGSGYGAADRAGLVASATAQVAAAKQARTMLEAAGIAVATVSIGSTPTTYADVSADGATEIRAGVYVFNDVMQAELGTCALDDIALSVLVTVIGHQKEQGRLIVDCGWRALSLDKSEKGSTYGVVCAAGTQQPIEDLRMVALSQEHGIIAAVDGAPLDLARYPVGTMFQILPHHACSTAGGHKHYHLCDAEWNVTAIVARG